MTKYIWEAKSNDGAFEDYSDSSFETKEEAYNDMRNSALEKMKWNTTFEDVNEVGDEYIGYSVKFYKDKIIHDSYSGIYTYEIKEVDTYEDEFWAYWDDLISLLDRSEKMLQNIGFEVWVTDCSEDRNLWAEWFKKNMGDTAIENLPISMDIGLRTNHEKDEINVKVASSILGEVYDSNFWRIESIPNNKADMLKFINKLTLVDRLLDISDNF